MAATNVELTQDPLSESAVIVHGSPAEDRAQNLCSKQIIERRGKRVSVYNDDVRLVTGEKRVDPCQRISSFRVQVRG